jgi:hypothetical protein
MTSVLKEKSASYRHEPSLGHFSGLSRADSGPMQMRSLKKPGVGFQIMSEIRRISLGRHGDNHMAIVMMMHACFMSRGRGRFQTP